MLMYRVPDLGYSSLGSSPGVVGPSLANQVSIHYTKAPEANYLDACAADSV